MRKINFKDFLFGTFLTCVIGITSVQGDWVIINNKNLEPPTQVEESKVCYIGSTYYTKVEKALEVAKNNNGADTIYIIPGVNPTITQNCEIGSGDTLILPYEGEKWDYGKPTKDLSDGFIDSNETNVNKYRVINLTLQNSVLTVNTNANLYIGGIFRARGICDKYTQITLEGNSSIKTSGKVINYGYIKEVAETNAQQKKLPSPNVKYTDQTGPNRYVEVLPGGTIRNALAVYNSLGASYLSGLNDKKICPVDTFDFPNAQTLIKVNSGGIVEAQAKIYVTSSAADKAVDKTATIVATKSLANANSSLKPLFFLESGYMTIRNIPTNILYSDVYSRTFVNIFGQMEVGYLYVDLEVAKIDTSNMFLPISYKLDIYLKENAVFTSNYQIKFLAGSTFGLDKGSKAYLNSDTIFYKSNTMNNLSTTYPKDKEDAKCINNGQIIFGKNAHFGGHITTSSADGSALIDTTQAGASNLSATSYESTSKIPVTFRATGDFYIPDTQTVEKKPLASGQQIISKTDGDNCWAGGFLEAYTLTIIVTNTDGYVHPAAAFKAYQYNSSGSGETMLSFAGGFETGVGSYEYLIEPNYKFKVLSLPRAKSAVFTKQNGTNYVFQSGQMFVMVKNIELTITAGEGIEMWFTSSSQSGDGGSSKTIMECGTSNGTYETLLVGGIQGNMEKVIIGKNQYFKYKYVRGTGLATVKGVYKFDGHVIATDSTTNGTLVGTGSTSNVTSNAVLADKEYTLLAYMEKAADPCFEKGTLISTKRGKVPVESLKSDDLILSYNHEIGEYEYKPIAAMINHGEASYNVISLDFSDGTNIGFITCHGLFDLDLNRYVNIDEENYSSFVGHRFAKTLGKDKEEIVLTKANIVEKVTNSYTVLASENINCEANGLLNITSVLEGIYNIFEYDDNHNFDLAKMNEDIERYGLYAYDDFKTVIDEKKFIDLGFKYFKVAIGKGILTDAVLDYYIHWFYECIENGQAEIY